MHSKPLLELEQWRFTTSAMGVFTMVVCTMCNGGPSGPSGHMVPAIKLLQSQSTISPFCTVTPQKCTPLKRLGSFWRCTTVESTKMYAVYSIWECHLECTSVLWNVHTCALFCTIVESLRRQGLICIGLRSPSVVIEAISLNNDRI